MKFEHIARGGTPTDFVTAANAFFEIHYGEAPDVFWSDEDSEKVEMILSGYNVDQWDKSKHFHFWIGTRDGEGCRIIAYSIPEKRVRLFFELEEKDYPGLLSLWEELRAELERLGWKFGELSEKEVQESIDKPRKYGSSRFSDKEKRQAVRKWEKLDKGKNPITLKKFLERFGEDNGIPRVKESTFYAWRRKYLKDTLE